VKHPASPPSIRGFPHGNASGITVLALLVLLGVTITVRELTPPDVPAVDTRMRSGSHMTLVVLAPTGAGDRGLEADIAEAKSAVRRRAHESGFYFSTVGISVDWSVSNGLRILSGLADFDEVIVGRNWLNSGARRYIHDLRGEPSVPQVVVILEDIRVDTLPIQFGKPRQILQLIGPQAISEWASAGYPLPSSRT
jgi:hypothetical protein